MKDFIVPVGGAIIDFAKHIKAYPRTILSSKFGDGKSYFIEKIKKDPELAKDYEFLTIYPVNYQVVGNKDIFEILKRDILFQLMLHGMISGNVKLTEAEAFSWFVFKKGGSLMMDLLPYLAEVGLEKEESVKVLAAVKGLKLFKDLKQKYDKFKQENLETDDDRIEAFLDKADNSFIYECDVITKIIQKAIADYQRRTKKKVVLFVEDMDRIDPAHLFRILNVLSAHMDYCYKYFVKPDNSLVGNKFGLDNIVLVIDYHNLKCIYKHFYGEHTDFGGYISKFLSGVPFYYSLEELKCDYVIGKLTEITGLDTQFIESIFSKDVVKSKTMRETVQSFNIQKNVITKPIAPCGGQRVQLNDSFLKLMAIMRRLKWSDDEIKGTLLNLKSDNQSMFVRYVLPYMYLFGDESHRGFNRTINMSSKDDKASQTEIILNPETGTASMGTRWMRRGNEVEEKFEEYIDAMFDYIA